MNASLRNFLLISAKQAVRAVIGNAALSAMFPAVFNLHDWSHVLALLKAAGALVLGAEAAVWIPKIIAWAKSPTNGEVVP